MQRRFYHCDTCDHRWNDLFDKNDPDPDCPVCSFEAEPDHEAQAERERQNMQDILDGGQAPAVIGHKARAIDIAQKMAEETYGMTNMRDNSRPGDTAFMPDTPKTGAQRAAEAKEFMQAVASAQGRDEPTPAVIQAIGYDKDPAKAFFGGSGSVQGVRPPGPVGGPVAITTAPQAQAARAEGNDPMAKLHDAGKKGLLPQKYNVMAKAKMPKEAGV